MTPRSQDKELTHKRNLWRAAPILIGLIAVWLVWIARPRPRLGSDLRGPRPPGLFVEGEGCTRLEALRDFARELEKRGRLRADRYPYDPQDGIQAVRDYRKARDCYRSEGALSDAARAESAAAVLEARVDTDYAAARTSLTRALQSERWTLALVEARRLHRLTNHLGESEYAEWLEGIMGRANARQTMAP